jgi:hypothetical protein
MRKTITSSLQVAIAKAKRLFGGKPEIGAVAIGRYVYIGPSAGVPESRQKKEGLPPRVVLPVVMLPRERSKYAPKPPAIGARQLARQRLGGFAGRDPEIIRHEIEIARYDLKGET